MMHQRPNIPPYPDACHTDDRREECIPLRTKFLVVYNSDRDTLTTFGMTSGAGTSPGEGEVHLSPFVGMTGAEC